RARARPLRSLLLLLLEDLAALLDALVLAHLQHALALAGVLPGAAIARAGTRALSLAGVDAGAAHVATGLLVAVGARRHGAAQDERRGRARNQHSLRLAHWSSLYWFRC